MSDEEILCLSNQISINGRWWLGGVNNTYMVFGPFFGKSAIYSCYILGTREEVMCFLEIKLQVMITQSIVREFINLIIASTGFSASSRVIQTSDRLLNELMMMTR